MNYKTMTTNHLEISYKMGLKFIKQAILTDQEEKLSKYIKEEENKLVKIGKELLERKTKNNFNKDYDESLRVYFYKNINQDIKVFKEQVRLSKEFRNLDRNVGVGGQL